MTLDPETWRLIAMGFGGLFFLLGIGGVLVLVIANKKKVDASPALPSVQRKVEENVEEVPFADSDFTTTTAAKPATSSAPLSRRALRDQPTDTPRVTAAKSFFADDDDDDFDFTSGRD